jgi:hypothetical protein
LKKKHFLESDEAHSMKQFEKKISSLMKPDPSPAWRSEVPGRPISTSLCRFLGCRFCKSYRYVCKSR